MIAPLQQQRLKTAWFQYLWQRQFNRFVTFNFNRDDMTIEAGHRLLGKFGTRVNRELHGRYYHRLPNEWRTYFIAIPEHLGSNLHFHAALWTPDAVRFDAEAEAMWLSIIAPGQLNYECKVFTEDDIKTIAAYITKCTAKEDTFADIYLFSNQHNLMQP